VTATDRAEELNEVLDVPRTRVETTVERTVLAELGGGCIAPIGVYAVLQGAYVHVTVQVFGPEGEECVEASRDLPVERHASAAADFAADLHDRGAGELIRQAAEAAE
jgi:hydroxymethylbilane synthase